MPPRAVLAIAVLGAAIATALLVWNGFKPAPVVAPAPAPVAAPAPGAAPAPLDASAPPMPAAGAPISGTDVALRTRAAGGDGAAAWRWYREQADCRRWRDWSAAPEGFARKLIDGVAAADRDPPFFAMPPDEFEAFRDPSATAEVSAAHAQNLMERLETLCRDATAANDADLYDIAARAAESGPRQALWAFIDEPPFDVANDAARRRDWAERATKLAERRLAAGDAEAAFALGVAYAKDSYDEGYKGAKRRDPLNAALANDPARAYELLTLYLRTQPEPRRQERTQQLLAEIGATLDESERRDAETRAEALRQRHFTGRED